MFFSLFPLLFTTVQRADRLRDSIDARSYSDGKERTSYIELRYGKEDLIDDFDCTSFYYY